MLRRSQCPRGVRRCSAAARLLRLWFRIPPVALMFVCCTVLCVLWGRGLCVGLVTRPDESYRLWWDVECDLETLWIRKSWPTWSCRAKNKGNKNCYRVYVLGIYISWMCGFRFSRVNNSVGVILLISCARGLEWLHLLKKAVCFSNSVYGDECFYDNGNISFKCYRFYSCTCTTIVKSLQVTLTIRTTRNDNTHTSLNKLRTEIRILSLFILRVHKQTIIINTTQSQYTRRWY